MQTRKRKRRRKETKNHFSEQFERTRKEESKYQKRKVEEPEEMSRRTRNRSKSYCFDTSLITPLSFLVILLHPLFKRERERDGGREREILRSSFDTENVSSFSLLFGKRDFIFRFKIFVPPSRNIFLSLLSLSLFSLSQYFFSFFFLSPKESLPQCFRMM